MTVLLLAIVLGAPADAQALVGSRSAAATCSVQIFAVDRQGRVVPTRTASASRNGAVVFRGRAGRAPEEDPPLVFDVFNPRGQRYQVLLGRAYGPSWVVNSRGRAVAGGPVQATIAVAGSSIQWTSMYGRWRVVPRFEGEDAPCGRAQPFTILP